MQGTAWASETLKPGDFLRGSFKQSLNVMGDEVFRPIVHFTFAFTNQAPGLLHNLRRSWVSKDLNQSSVQR